MCTSIFNKATIKTISIAADYGAGTLYSMSTGVFGGQPKSLALLNFFSLEPKIPKSHLQS